MSILVSILYNSFGIILPIEGIIILIAFGIMIGKDETYDIYKRGFKIKEFLRVIGVSIFSREGDKGIGGTFNPFFFFWKKKKQINEKKEEEKDWKEGLESFLEKKRGWGFEKKNNSKGINNVLEGGIEYSIFSLYFILLNIYLIIRYHEGNLDINIFFYKYIIIFFLLLVFKLYSNKEIIPLKGDILFILLFSYLGLMMVLFSNNFLYIYIALELFGFTSYILAGSSFSRSSIEGALKYFLNGTLATFLILLSLVLIYASSGSLEFTFFTGISTFPFYLFLFGIFLKLGLPPVHFWVVNVYEHIPFFIFAYFLIIPKFIFILFLIKFLNIAPFCSTFILFLALANIIVGTLTAFTQYNLKRLFTLSSISTFGYVLLPFSKGISASSKEAAIAYMTFYTLLLIPTLHILYKNQYNNNFFSRTKTSLGAKKNNISTLFSQDVTLLTLTSLSPLDKFYFIIFLLISTGLPPFIIFYSKAFLIFNFIQTSSYLLALILFLFSALSAAYYLNLIKIVLFRKEEKNTITSITSIPFSSLSILPPFLIIFFGISPIIFYLYVNFLFFI